MTPITIPQRGQVEPVDSSAPVPPGSTVTEAQWPMRPGLPLPGPAPPAGQRTDEQLLADHISGDRTAFGELVERHRRELFNFLARFLGNRATAEDVFQETFLQIHRSARQFDPQRSFRPWMFAIATNKARDLLRRQSRRPAQPLQSAIRPENEQSLQFLDLMGSPAETPDEPMQRRELQRLVHETVASMPEHLREILLLSYFHQFPYRQIGEILRIPLGTVKSRLHAAVACFADRWRAAGREALTT